MSEASPSFHPTNRVCALWFVFFQGTVEVCSPARIEVYKGEWFMCSWKITNSGGVAFPEATRLSRVCSYAKQLSSFAAGVC